MRPSRLVVGLLVVSLLAVSVASGPAAAQIEGTDQEEAAICGGAPAGNSLVLVLPGDTYVHSDDTTTLLPGTTAELALCSDGELQTAPAAWDVDEGAVTGINVTAEHDYSYAVTVESVEESTPIEFALNSGPGSVASPTVTATPGKVAVARVDGDAYRVTVAGDRDRFERANASYTAALDGMRTAAADLEANAGSLDPNPGVPDDERRPQINRTRAVTTNYSTIQTVLFRSATSGNAEAVAALDAYEERHVAAVTETRESLESANRAIARQAGATALGVLANLVAVGIVGLVGGGVVGRFLTNRILSDVEVERRRSSAVDFRPRHIAGQLLLALVVVGGAVTLVVTQNLLDPLVAVVSAAVRAVIGL